VIDFAQPVYFALAVLVAAMAGLVLYTGVWRRRALSEFAGPQASRWGGSGFWLRSLVLLFAAGLIVFAAARPQWDTEEVFREREGIDYVIALDISKSMTADDVAPTRLEAAQEELIRLVESERGSRAGLVLFAGTAFLRSPLTSDTEAMTQLIRRAGSEVGLTRVGSDLGAALDVAATILSAFDDERGKAIILVSDGEDFAGTYLEKAQELSEQGITVLTAGVGTPEGATLFEENFDGELEVKLDEDGLPIISRLDESSLRAIAEATGGRYETISDGTRNLLELSLDLRGLDSSAISADRSVVPIERFQIFVAIALVLLVVAWFLPARLPLPRLRRVHPRPAFAALLLALLIGACGGEEGEDTSSLRARNEEANQLYAAGDYAGALAIYQELIAERPDVDELSYNAGNALHRLQSYDRAVSATSRALPPREVDLGADTYYSLGNHLLMLDRLDQAYVAYRQALLLNPDDADAKHNLELVLRLALAQEEQQEPSGQQPPGDDGQPPPGEPGEGTPAPGEPGDPSGEPGGSPQPGSPEPGAGQTEGTPQPGSATGSDRTLEEALAGIDEDVSFEEALEILDLLRERQQRPRTSPGGSPSGPDY
jgi:Ca-activated chloride channel family protein